jgi:hypothetical protein
MDAQLPRKCFISHSYADAEARDQIIAKLPFDVKPYVFPPITVPPDQFVSNELIHAITDCDALIYLKGGSSDRSFWVAFERDYALRIGKKVFSVDITTRELTLHSKKPIDLNVFASYHHKDRKQVHEIAKFMKNQRYFDLWIDYEKIQPGTKFDETINSSLEDRLQRGGYVVVFWSASSSGSKWVQSEIQKAAEGIKDFNDRVLFALLENSPVPGWWLKFQEPAVQLYGDHKRSVNQRVDDLVVRLYWLIYRKTEQRNLD